MAETEMKQKVVKGLLWKLLENGGAQGVQFVIAIILARLLTPAQYGVVGIITIFITIANVVVQSGFSTALVQKQKADKVDFSSVCYFDLFVALVMYGILYAAAPVNCVFLWNCRAGSDCTGTFDRLISRCGDFCPDSICIPESGI